MDQRQDPPDGDGDGDEAGRKADFGRAADLEAGR
jgi:hypothetical protein